MSGQPSTLSILAAAMLLLAGCARSEEHEPPAEMEVSGWTWGFSYSGDYCEGRGFARNKGDASLGNVRFQVRVVDAGDRTVASGPGRIDKPMLEPGEAAPFSFFLPCPTSSSAAELTATHGLGAPVAIHIKQEGVRPARASP